MITDLAGLDRHGLDLLAAGGCGQRDEHRGGWLGRSHRPAAGIGSMVVHAAEVMRGQPPPGGDSRRQECHPHERSFEPAGGLGLFALDSPRVG